ncbi:MAG: DUF5009 domain-containing protein [Mucinivorans sp.]
MTPKPPRLLSLDILRGFDLFMLVVFCPLLLLLNIDADWYRAVCTQFTHVTWAGFHVWDLVMPLFMFCSGVTIPFALSRYKNSTAPRSELFVRLAKRVALLWILGMVIQGNLLSFSFTDLKFFSNTLQAIAVGYLVASLAFVYLSKKASYVLAAVLLLSYWAAMTFVGGSDYGPTTNLAYRIDMSVMGGFRDGASIDAATGAVSYSGSYYYTWILSSLTFAVTVMGGMFAGAWLRVERFTGAQKAARLVIAGAVCVAVGWIWNLEMPVIKPIWTSSMTLVSSGYSLLLLALFYYVIDVRGFQRGLGFLRVYGLNSIVAYVLGETPWIKAFCISITSGLRQHTGDHYPLVVEVASVALIFWILYIMYRNNKFLRV